MSDLISRQDVIHAIDLRLAQLNAIRFPITASFDDGLLDGYYRIRSDVSTIPSAKPKKGTWVDYSEDGFVECPFCGSATNCDGNKEELHFCFSCGADMRGEQDE